MLHKTDAIHCLIIFSLLTASPKVTICLLLVCISDSFRVFSPYFSPLLKTIFIWKLIYDFIFDTNISKLSFVTLNLFLNCKNQFSRVLETIASPRGFPSEVVFPTSDGNARGDAIVLDSYKLCVFRICFDLFLTEVCAFMNSKKSVFRTFLCNGWIYLLKWNLM
jgi:hypothetical protein